MSAGPPGPWTSTHHLPDSCLPVIQHFPKAALRAKKQSNSASSSNISLDDVPLGNSTQSAKLLPFQYGSSLEPQILRQDAMYAVSGIFAFAACSESQFVNFMSVQVEAALRSSERQAELSLSDLRFSKSLLDEHAMYLQDVIMFFQHEAETKWPTSTSAVPGDVQAALLKDFECLLRRVKDLAARCLDGTAIIMNDAMLQESRRAIAQAGKVERLTLLAFFFVPLTFTCTLFGMNFSEFGQGHLSIYIFGIIVPPIVMVSTIVCYWGSISTWVASFVKS